MSKVAYRSGTQVLAGGIERVLANGFAEATVLSNGTFQINDGSTIATQILYGAQQYVDSGAFDSGSVASSGGVQRVFSGASPLPRLSWVAAISSIMAARLGRNLGQGAYQYVYAAACQRNERREQRRAVHRRRRNSQLEHSANGTYQLDYGAVSGTRWAMERSSTSSHRQQHQRRQRHHPYVFAGGSASGTTIGSNGYQLATARRARRC